MFAKVIMRNEEEKNVVAIKYRVFSEVIFAFLYTFNKCNLVLYSVALAHAHAHTSLQVSIIYNELKPKGV